MKNPETLSLQPEPILVAFLKKNRLYTDIVDGKIKAIAINAVNPELKVTSKFITAEELNNAGEWVEENAPELHDHPLFSFNMKHLRPLLHELFLSSRIGENVNG